MGALAAAGWAGSAHGETRYGGKWAWLGAVIARQAAGRCASAGTDISGISGQSTITQSTIVACAI